MELKEAILKRKSIRQYESTPIPEDKLLRVLEAARLAPSGSNRQAWKFIVVKDAKRRKELSKASAGQAQVAQAPVVIAAVSTSPEQMMMCDVPAYAVDLAIAVDHLTLASVDEGLGTCWIAAFDPRIVSEVLGIPEGIEPLLLTPLGYPAVTAQPRERRALDEIVHWVRWTAS